MQFILASSSLGRKKILKSLGLSFKVIPSSVDEEKIIAKSPLKTLQLRAKLKEEDVVKKLLSNKTKKQTFKDAKFQRDEKAKGQFNYLTIKQFNNFSTPFLILSADSGVIFGKELIGKPKDHQEAANILKKLSGKTHKFVTAIYVTKSKTAKTGSDPKAYKVWQDYEVSLVTFRELSKEDIDLYLSLTDYTRYAGGYTLFASPQNFITKIQGSLSNVIGLPLEKIIPILRENNLLTPDVPI